MASRKTPFEVVHARPNARQRAQVPKWWRSTPAPGGGLAGKQSSSTQEGNLGWLSKPVDIRLTRGILLWCAFILVAALVAAYQLGVRRAGATADQRSSAAMTQLGQQPVNPQLMRTAEGELTVETVGGGRVSNPVQAAPVTGDPRIPGLYYYCLATTPIRYRPEAERAVEFLRRNGVDAAVLPVNNRQIQVVALKGFPRPNGPEAQDYEKLLRALGRVWKAEHRGFSDWSDLYAPKYTPGSQTDGSP